MADYSKFVALALKKINEKGGDGILKRTATIAAAPTPTSTGFNKRAGGPTDSSNVPVIPGSSTVLNEPVRAVRGSQELSDVSSVPKYVTTFLMTVEPRIGDTLFFGGKDYRIDSVAVVGPDGTPILYKAKVT